MARIGPALRMMCGIASSDSSADAVAAVAAWLHGRIATLASETQRMCMLLVFGLHETTRVRHVHERLTTAATWLGKTERTARRYSDAAIATIAATTPPSQSIPLQLRGHVGGWVDLGVAQDTRYDRSNNVTFKDSDVVRRVDGEYVVTTRCFLIAVARYPDPTDRILAVVRFGTNPRVATAVPAVRVRHVTSTVFGSDVLNIEGRET